jgi:glycosyltransferase involved in cell wall biosynthesis
VHIAFVIPDLGPGGAERVAALLADYWVGEGHNVTMATFEMPGTEPFFPLEERVAVRDLGASAPSRRLTVRIGNNIARVSRLRSLLRDIRPDIVVAFMTEANVLALCAAKGLGVPVVISERNQPDRPGLGALHRLARRLAYPLARAMVVQTEEIAAWAAACFRIPVHIIPNPVVLGQDRGNGKLGDTHLIVSLGRLTHQKGFDILVKSFAALASKHPDWQLVIYGEGPDRVSLERLRAERRLEDRICLPGLTRDSFEALRRASLFALPSRFEGYPNALLEALGCGLPVIATSCPGGTAQILANGVYGILVPPDDIATLTSALDAMMSAADLRKSYASRARTAVAHLDIEIIGQRWLHLLSG